MLNLDFIPLRCVFLGFFLFRENEKKIDFTELCFMDFYKCYEFTFVNLQGVKMFGVVNIYAFSVIFLFTRTYCFS